MNPIGYLSTHIITQATDPTMHILEENRIFFLTKKSLQTLSDAVSRLNPSKIVVLTDRNSKKHCYPHIKNALPKHHVFSIPAGEEFKTLDTCVSIWNYMTQIELDRKALIINLGGGVLGDMGGFCAATYKRGLRYIQMPTTLLSMVDASVGGKLGIDFFGLKNHIGVFSLPESVFLYPEFIRTLPPREIRSGYAEIIKHGLIQDASLWNLCKSLSYETIINPTTDWTETIRVSVEIKAQVVQQDPTEKGLRKILNFGHTLGHAIETYMLQKDHKVMHGEAIAAGMIAEAYISYKMKFISEDQLTEIATYLSHIYGHIALDALDFSPIIALTRQDKKNSHGSVQYALITTIGSCGYDFKPNPTFIKSALAYYVEVSK